MHFVMAGNSKCLLQKKQMASVSIFRSPNEKSRRLSHPLSANSNSLSLFLNFESAFCTYFSDAL